MARVQPALQVLTIPGHAETENPESKSHEHVALHVEPQPIGVGGHRLGHSEKVEQPDNEHQGRVLEQADEGVDDAGNDDFQGLRQDNEPHHAPVAQAERLGRLELALRYRLQATAHHLGHVRRRERPDPHQRPPPPVESAAGALVDYGLVGDIESVDASILRKQLDNGLMPVVSPLSCDPDGTLLNINADTVAAGIAAELDAEKLILATGAPGILEDISDPQSLISYIDREGLRKLKTEGKLADGMLPKAAAIDEALRDGVRRVHVISYKLPDSLLLEVFTNEGTGTLVVNDIEGLTAAEQEASS